MILEKPLGPRVADTVLALAAARLEGKESNKRQPRVSFQFWQDGHGLVFKPTLRKDYQSQQWQLGHLSLELMQLFEVDGFPRPAAWVNVSVRKHNYMSLTRWPTKSDQRERAIGKLMLMLDAFERNPGSVIAGQERCCVCGRSLTDDVSQARGIGPECIKWGNFLLEYHWEPPSIEPLITRVRRALGDASLQLSTMETGYSNDYVGLKDESWSLIDVELSSFEIDVTEKENPKISNEFNALFIPCNEAMQQYKALAEKLTHETGEAWEVISESGRHRIAFVQNGEPFHGGFVSFLGKDDYPLIPIGVGVRL